MEILRDAIFRATDLIAALSSIVVAIWVGNAVVQSQKDQRQHNRLSVRPILHISVYRDWETTTVKYYIVNHGVGPAVIENIEVASRDGITVGGRTAIYNILHRLIPDWPKYTSVLETSFRGKYSLPAGEELIIAKFKVEEGAPIEKFEHLGSVISKEVICTLRYTNIYGDVFIDNDP